MDTLLLLPAVNCGSCLSPLPFPAPFHHRVVQQTIEKRLFWSLQRHQTYAWYKSFSFHEASKPFHAKQQTAHEHTKTYDMYSNIVRCTDLSQENKMHTSQHHCIHYWAIQRSWFARVNALWNPSRKKSREVAAHFRADFWVGVASLCV